MLEHATFSTIATGGAGRPANATAHAMAVFKGRLYVGVGAANVTGLDDAPRILRYDEPAGAWHVVYESPLIEATARSFVPDKHMALHSKSSKPRDRTAFAQRATGTVPRDIGFRAMCVFQGASDPEPALYVSTLSRTGGLLLRSLDGRHFEVVGAPGLGNPDIFSFCGLKALGGRLFAAASGTVTDSFLDRLAPPQVTILVSEDPASGTWRPACTDGFGDAGNQGVYDLAVAHGHLYAGTCNPERGLQVWRTRAEGEAPFHWEQVVTDGAGAFNHNLATSAMAEFNGDLYVGSGITGHGHDPVHDIGPASAELMRIHEDGSWDLIAGTMRFTDQGLKVPFSLLGPGLGDFYNSVVWALAEHEGTLYLGTHQWEPFRAMEVQPDRVVGGYQLWASEDGESWRLLIENGHGNPAQVGIRALVSTPFGLAIGTHNQSRLLRLLARRHNASADFPEGFEVLLKR